MGCGASKEDDLPLVIQCRERKALIRTAADHRYALAASHIMYFHSLVGVGDALRQFIDEELLIPSPTASPVLTLPSDEGKTKNKNKNRSINNDNKTAKISSPSSTSGSHIHLSDEEHDHDHDKEGHLHLSSGSDSDFDSSPGHIHLHDSPRGKDEGSAYSSPSYQTGWRLFEMYPEMGWEPYGVNPPYPMNPPPQSDWNQYGTQSTSYKYYMKRSAPQVQSVIYDPKSSSSWQVPEASTSYINSYPTNQYENGGFYGYPMQPKRPADPPPPPSPKASGWDFFNPFDGYDSGYPGYTYGSYAYGSVASSPDSTEVREREGIPDLEDETECEVSRQTYRGKKLNRDKMRKRVGKGRSTGPSQKQYSDMSQKQPTEGSSSGVPSHGFSEGTRDIPSQSSGVSEISEVAYSVDVKEVKSSPDNNATNNTKDGSMRKKGVTFEIETTQMQDIDASRLSSLHMLSARGTRDLKEVVAEIRDEFATAYDHGKEVAMLLEVGKLPHQPRFALLRVILSRILYMIAPSSPSSHLPSRGSVRFSYKTMKLAKAYYEDSAKTGMRPGNLSLTLEKLYVWEKKLYKEVKDEESLRVIYERQCKRLKVLDDHGAEDSKIDAMQASIRKLQTKLNVCIRAVDSISRRIQKLRDEDLQPQVSELIYGLIRMWRSMLKCHQKQFQAIIESKARSLRMNINSHGGSSLKATLELEIELRTWYAHFSDWITTQKSFIESLNGWLKRCIFYEPENTPDGVIPYSPGRIGAPQMFVISNDWSQAIASISEKKVAKTMKNFASSLEQLMEIQGEEQRQRLKAEYFSKDFEKRLRALRMERGKIDISDSVSLVSSNSGVSTLDDLKVDLDSIKKRWVEEKEKQKEGTKLAHSSDSSSIQSGLIPIFESLRNFTSEALKAYEHVRIQNGTQPKCKT